MGPLSILTVVQAAKDIIGEDATETLLQSAQIYRLPSEDEPVREARVAALHQTLRADCPDFAPEISRHAGRLTADYVMNYRMSRRAQSMLIAAPWQISSWLLGRSTLQNAWTFSGSGKFTILNRMEFSLSHNPVLRGETAPHPVCDYHASLFTRLFQSLVHEKLVCKEVTCSACGADACHFVLTPEGEMS
jgi:divinyl protochlorophyllide a 8-vinyl-reductase